MPILITNDFPPAHGGIQRLMSRLAGGIAARGGEVLVVAPQAEGGAAIDAGLPYPVIRYAVRRRKLAAVLAMSLSFVRALRTVRERVTIASVWWPVAFAVALVPPPLRGRFVVLAHGSEIAANRTGLRRLAMRFVYGQAHAVLANSSFTRGLLASVGIRDNVSVFRLGVDSRTVAPARSSVPTLLSVGRLLERKGFDRVLEALAYLAADFPTLQYEIIGEGPQLAYLQRRAAELGVAARVRFHGNVSDEELWRAYARAWCFALPVRSVDDDVEGFGIVYLEAAMANVPSIGGIGSGAAEAIEDGVTGLLVDGTDTTALVGAVRRLLSDPELRDRLGRQARERAANDFTWARTTEDVLRYLAC